MGGNCLEEVGNIFSSMAKKLAAKKQAILKVTPRNF
jgi:hypothetical protein